MKISENDIERCKTPIRNLFLSRIGFELNDIQLSDITKDIMQISDSHGGDFSNDIILDFAKGYIDSQLYLKYIDSNEDGLEVLINNAKSDIENILNYPETMPAYMSKSQLEMIVKELDSMAYNKGQGSFYPYYPRGIADCWDYNDNLAKKLMYIAEIYQKLKYEVRKK